jgi:hypothetical protein
LDRFPMALPSSRIGFWRMVLGISTTFSESAGGRSFRTRSATSRWTRGLGRPLKRIAVY